MNTSQLGVQDLNDADLVSIEGGNPAVVAVIIVAAVYYYYYIA